MKEATGRRSPEIENIVAAGSIAEALDIEYITEQLDGCVLNKKRFPGAIYHMKDPKIVALLFSSGKIVLTGIKTTEEFRKGLDLLIAQAHDLGITTFDVPEVSVTNIVCSYDTGMQINLNKVVITFNLEHIEYEPERFPGLIYRIPDPKIVALLFSSGKIILTGGKTMGDVERAVEYMTEKLRDTF